MCLYQGAGCLKTLFSNPGMFVKTRRATMVWLCPRGWRPSLWEWYIVFMQILFARNVGPAQNYNHVLAIYCGGSWSYSDDLDFWRSFTASKCSPSLAIINKIHTQKKEREMSSFLTCFWSTHTGSSEWTTLCESKPRPNDKGAWGELRCATQWPPSRHSGIGLEWWAHHPWERETYLGLWLYPTSSSRNLTKEHASVGG